MTPTKPETAPETRHSVAENYRSTVLLLTNLSYLVPAVVLAFKARRIYGTVSLEEGIIMIIFLLITFFTSWSYHQCRGFHAAHSHGDFNQHNVEMPISQCAACHNTPMSWLEHMPFSQARLKYFMLKFDDYFMAMFSIVATILYVTPFRECVKRLFLVVTVVWLLLFLSVQNDTLALLPVLAIMALFFLFWYSVYPYNKDPWRNYAWGSAVSFLVLAVFFFEIDKEPYWLKHSLWHIMGGLGIAFVLAKSAGRYEDIDHKAFAESLSAPLQALFRESDQLCHW